MNRFLTHSAAIIVLLLAASASGQEAAGVDHDAGLIGEWRGAAVKSSLNTQLALSLFRDGSYVRRMVIVTEFAWTAEPHILNIAQVTRKGTDIEYGQAMAVRMTVTATSLTTRFGNDSIVLYRLGAQTSDTSVVGRWQGENAAGEEVIEEFAPDGQLLVMVTVARDAGRFSIGQDEIEWQQQIPSEGKRKEKFRIEGRRLKLFVDTGGAPVVLTLGPVQPPG